MPKVFLALLAATALAGCGTAEPSARPPKRAGKPIHCPSNVPQAKALDARTVVGLAEHRAAAMARRTGCTMVAVARDGERFALTANLDRTRLQVEVNDGVVTRIVTVG